MLSETKSEKDLKLSQALTQLNTLMHEITNDPSCLEANLRAFVSIYVRVNSLSEDVFIALCEHEVIQKLFGPEARQMGVIGVLEMFNLILANTSQTNTLVYIFSQPAVHEYLFTRFNANSQNSQAVEYYIQLLKTIIMKMNNGQSSLIKMFCNNRYCSFPLLSQVCYLATQSKEELVRVTAQQCVLLLIQLLQSKQVGRGYLAEIQMAVFYHQITLELTSQTADFEGYLKYVVDLLVALQGNTLSLTMLLNCFCINVIVGLLHDLPFLLKIIRTLSSILTEQQELSRTLYIEIKIIIGSILARYCFSQFLNGTYLYSLKYKKSYPDKLTYSQLTKLYRTRFESLHHFLHDIEHYSDQQFNSLTVLTAWQEFNRSRDLRDLKLGEEKKTGIFKFFQSKVDSVESYLRVVLASNGFSYDNINKTFLFKIEKTIHAGSAIFFVEKVLLREKPKLSKEITQSEVHFNDNRGNFDFSLSFCSQILSMLGRLEDQGICINMEVPAQKLKDLQFELQFLRRLKLYLINNLSDFVLRTDKEYNPAQICQIRKLLRKIEISNHLEKRTVQKLLWKLEQLQTELNELTFMREFKLLIKYILHGYSDQLHAAEGDLPSHLEDPIFSNMLKYEFISEVIDPTRLSIQHFIEQQWKTFIMDQSNHSRLTFKHENQKYRFTVSPMTSMKFEVYIKDCYDKELLAVEVRQAQSFLQIIEKQKLLGWSCDRQDVDEQNLKLVAAQLVKVCSKRQEVITKWIVQYFQMTYNCLCSLLGKKHQKSMIIDRF